MRRKLLSTVSERLKLIWSNYLYLKQIAEKEHKLPPSSAPCHPAPGRRLLIIRSDTLSPNTVSHLIGFDGIVAPSLSLESKSAARKRHSALADLSRTDSTNYNIPAEALSGPKKKWSLLGKIIPFGTEETSQVPTTNKSLSSNSQKLEQVRQATAAARVSRPTVQSKHKSSSSIDSSTSTTSKASHRAYSFKFSLEWHPSHQSPSHKANYGRDRRLSPPRLPGPAQSWLVGQVPGTADEVPSMKPKGYGDGKDCQSTYAGRALAEWTLLMLEYNNFVDRRRGEGVPTLKAMEVPLLTVEGFRKYI